MNMHIYTMYVHVHVCACTHMNGCMSTFEHCYKSHTRTDTQTHTHKCAHMHAGMHTCVHAWVCSWICKCPHLFATHWVRKVVVMRSEAGNNLCSFRILPYPCRIKYKMNSETSIHCTSLRIQHFVGSGHTQTHMQPAIFPANPRFHTTPVTKNLGLTQTYPHPTHGDQSPPQFHGNTVISSQQ